MTPVSSTCRSSPRWFGPLLALFAVAASVDGGKRYSFTTVEGAGVTLVVLRDDAAGMEAAIVPREGGELSGLRVRYRGEWLELLHRARDYRPAVGWRGKAPLLWPAVGRNFSRTQPPNPNAEMCSYDFAGRRYDLPIHGFTRLHAWRVIDTRADADSAAVEVELTDDAETRRQYPFRFNIRIVYRLAAGRLTLTHRIAAARENAFAGSIAYFNTTRENIQVQIFNTTTGLTTFEPSSEEQAEGIETDFQYFPTKQFQLSARTPGPAAGWFPTRSAPAASAPRCPTCGATPCASGQIHLRGRRADKVWIGAGYLYTSQMIGNRNPRALQDPRRRLAPLGRRRRLHDQDRQGQVNYVLNAENLADEDYIDSRFVRGRPFKLKFSASFTF